MMRRRILVIDDMEFNRDHLRKLLESDDFEVDTCGDGRSAWERLKAQKYHLVITDLRMPELGGLELLGRVRSENMPLGVIVLTAFGDPEEALRAMKAGADDFVSKPYDPDRLRMLVKRILERRELIDELELLRKQIRGDYPFHNMVSKSPKIRKIFDLIEQVAPLGSTVLIHGETGTGKELVAQALHTADQARSGPFAALNCAVLNESLLESELFGHERGAFTGAEKRKIGRFEMANGGTLLLDEIGDLAPGLQAKLLRSLANGLFRAGRRHRQRESRRTDRRGHPSGARRRGQKRALPRRPVLPLERDPDRATTAAQSAPKIFRSWRRISCKSTALRPAPTSPRSPRMRCRRSCGIPGRATCANSKTRSSRPWPWLTGQSCAATTCPSRWRSSRAAAASRLAAGYRTTASRPDLRLDWPGRTRILCPRPFAFQGQRGPNCPPQRFIAAERDPEAATIQARPELVQAHRAAWIAGPVELSSFNRRNSSGTWGTRAGFIQWVWPAASLALRRWPMYRQIAAERGAMRVHLQMRKGCLMVRALLICCAMFGDDANKAIPAAGDHAGYEAILKKTAETATAQIQLALWCEAHGMGPERDLHLQRAIKLEPGNALARGLLGMIAFKGQWTKPEQVEQATQSDPKFQAIFREYLNRRVHTPQKVDPQLRLAAWCAQNGLNEEAMVHYQAVTRIDPSRDIAWIKLGYKKNKDRWVKLDDLAAQKLELELQKKADSHWKTRLEKLREAIDSKAEARRLKAERELYEINDPRAVAMIWRTFGTGGEKSRLLTVTLLSQIEGPASSFWLAALALDKTSAIVRERAAAALARRDPRDVIGHLIGLIHRPYRYKVVPGTGPGSTGAPWLTANDLTCNGSTGFPIWMFAWRRRSRPSGRTTRTYPMPTRRRR